MRLSCGSSILIGEAIAMAWVKMIGPSAASGPLKAEYDRIAAQFAARGGAIPGYV